MKKIVIGILTLVSLSAMAKPCDLEIIENVMEGKVGEKVREMLQKIEKANTEGNTDLAVKTAEQGQKVLYQVVELAAEACK